jgi:hypothetical protein
MISSELHDRPYAPGLAETTFAWFSRLVAVYCLAFGVLYWVRLVGFYEGSLWRFDLMPVHWRVAAVSLAVLFPFAGIGLWMLASWGAVIWLICAATESLMYFGFPELFGFRWPVLATHAGVLAVYLGLRFAIYLQKRAER